MPQNLKIFGERNTATNALKQILETNSCSRCLPSVSSEIDPGIIRRDKIFYRLPRQFPFTRGIAARMRERDIDRIFSRAPDTHSWKHAATNFPSAEAFDGLNIIVTVRNPASWLFSLYKNAYHILGPRPDTLPDFLNYAWETVGRERLNRRTFRPLDLYSEKLKAYLRFFEKLDRTGVPYRLVQFEDIVTDQEKAFGPLRTLLSNPSAQFTPVEESTKSKSKSRDFYRDYYRNERWRDEMGEAYDLVRHAFSTTLAGEFRYNL